MADVFRRRALYTNAKQAKHTYVSLDGDLEQRRTRGGGDKTSLLFERLAFSGFLYRTGIREGDRLTEVNFYPAEKIPFDLLVETIRGLSPLVLTVERTLREDELVTIVVVIEIDTDQRDEPYLKFHGLYFFKDTDSLETEDIIKFIPVEVEPLTTYEYSPPPVQDVKIFTQQGNDQLFLTVDGNKVEFRKQDSSKATFTMYKYNSDVVPDPGTPVILVPADEPSQCLAATSNNVFKLVVFDESEWTGSDPLPQNGRFLLLHEISSNLYNIESSMVEGQYLTVGQDDQAVMSAQGSSFSITDVNAQPLHIRPQ